MSALSEPDLRASILDDRDRGIFRVKRLLLTSDAVWQLERRRIFDKCWLYIGHASEIRKPGDYVRRQVAAAARRDGPDPSRSGAPRSGPRGPGGGGDAQHSADARRLPGHRLPGRDLVVLLTGLRVAHDRRSVRSDRADRPVRRYGGKAFERVPFDHPLWIVYSSGTTGLPKAIVHGRGGIVLEH